MSAIAKPFVHFTGAINAAEQSKYVPVENIQSVEPWDEVASPQNNNKASYYILITSLRPNGQTKEIKIKFLTSTLRNTSLTNFKSAMSTAVAGT